MANKKPEPNPIEEAIGPRAKTPESNSPPTPVGDLNDLPENVRMPEEPSPSEMLALEELQRQTEERLQDEPEQTTVIHTVPKVPIIPVSKPENQPATGHYSQESPPQEIDEIDEYQDAEKHETQQGEEEQVTREKLPELIDKVLSPHEKDADLKKALATIYETTKKTPAEDVELTALKKYIREDGFVLATAAFHIVTLCDQPMVTPSTTAWDFKDRASVPDMVLALLNQPGYIEGIWPSLKIVMSSNVGNAAWCAGIATTIAFFDTIRVLPTLKELQIEENEKKS